jgi:hypothetical protein
VLLFGGLLSPLDPADGVTWVLDGDRWEGREPPTSPPGRYHAGMVEDPAGNIVLFGGYQYDGWGHSVARLGDTWTWDGETWTEHDGAVSPSPRAYPHMVHDPVRDETVLFGGNDGEAETWVWDGQGWEQRNPPLSPPGRIGAAIAWDATSQRIVLFGGSTCASVVCLIGNDVWTWDGATWLPHESVGERPSPRRFSVAGPADGGIVLFGGIAGSGLPFSDTWLWRAELP